MSAAKCICMGPGSAPPLSMGMTSRQFSQPPCPCIKCKERAREQHEARVQAIAQSKLGICGQIASSGAGPGMGAAKGMGMGPVSNSGKCGRPEMGPRMGPGMGPGMGPVMGVGKAPGMGSCKGISMVPSSKPGTRTGPDMGPIVGACNRPGRGMGPGMGPAMGPNGHTNSDMEAINRSPPKQGCSPQKVTKNDVQSNDPKCQCLGAQLDAEREASSQDSTESPTGLIFGGAVTQRKSSITQGGYRQIIFPHSGCAAKDYDELDDDDNMLMANVDLGRDTFGLPVILQGNAGILNTGGFCRDTMLCDEFCGIGRGCSAACNKGSTAAATAAGQKTAGIRICSNEYINTILTFLMELLCRLHHHLLDYVGLLHCTVADRTEERESQCACGGWHRSQFAGPRLCRHIGHAQRGYLPTSCHRHTQRHRILGHHLDLQL
ncbi:uncharacterized protein LOC132796872 isoform X2 [Drosophila nasuta]|uniref:uncharacterized protein LOC132796872 isoform X2 n=1 Tax=Drosophila nasuta TaxID=42062 RepID=UPI00295E94DE|nr:uncharacterized protein LOC132796872 isoform X2 [Drosophila nasuta]